MPLNGENSLMEHDALNRVYLRHAYECALDSDDPNTQVGAILVHDEMGIVSTGANKICDRIPVHEKLLEYPLKANYMEHAERNAIYLAAQRGASTRGLTMYCPWFSCVGCARAIIQAGIVRVVGHKTLYDITPKRWLKEIEVGHQLLREAGVKTDIWSGEIGSGLTIRFNGKDISP